MKDKCKIHGMLYSWAFLAAGLECIGSQAWAKLKNSLLRVSHDLLGRCTSGQPAWALRGFGAVFVFIFVFVYLSQDGSEEGGFRGCYSCCDGK